ncbi:MAG: guanosine monophosphate reductase [Bdellovibrionaceae bacterium]|nr:guanosine monophosphate reductase [Pseudobdellovibrionaceae bacterium]
MFNWSNIKERSKAYSYDDVLIVPSMSNVKSRREPDLSSQLTKKVSLGLPFISANMDTITESDMAISMHNLGAMGILHRFMTIEDQVNEVKKVADKGIKNISASIGVNQDFKERAQALVEAGVNIVTVDIAHGHSVSMIETLDWLKSTFSHVEVIAGNVATPQGVEDLINSGADAIKVGIGPGSMCTTRVITGCGVPQLTAVALCAEVTKKHNVPLIADGGIKNSGDIMKALAAGADTVMLGSLLSGAIETPGPIKSGKKQYRGMASKSAQVSWRGGVPKGMAAEGESTMVSIKGHTKDVVFELAGGIRSGMSYINAMSIPEIKENAQFIEMSGMGHFESNAHGLGQRV